EGKCRPTPNTIRAAGPSQRRRPLRVRAPETLEGGRRFGGMLERPPVTAALEEHELPTNTLREPFGEARCDVGIVPAPEDEGRPPDACDVGLPLLPHAHGGAVEAEDALLHPLVHVPGRGPCVLRGHTGRGEALRERVG